VPNALTIRTSIVGRELKRHRSLLDWFLSQNGGTVRGFTRVIYSGLTTNHVAWLVSHIIRSHPELTGLYQAASEPISKHDLLCLIRSAYQMQVDIIPDEIEVSDRSMAGDKLRGSIGYVAPSWPELVRELAEDPTPYSLLSKTTPHESWKANREALKR
jgi:dTDP-4-dehydrorhamnose reductase